MGTHYSGSAREVRALNAFIKLMRAGGSVRARLEPNLTAERLTAAQFGVLEALLHLGPLNQRALGSKLLATKGNVSVVVDNLERDGLVRRVRGTEDRREWILHLTARGRRLVERVFRIQLDAIVNEFSALRASEQDTLARLCRKLGRQDDGTASREARARAPTRRRRKGQSVPA